MKSRPILFSAPMVRAILDGSKTQTRRVAKLVKTLPDGQGWDALQKPGTRTCLPLVDGQFQYKPYGGAPWEPYPNIAEYCPYGQAGDTIWVREEHYRFGHWEPVVGVKTKTGRQKWAFVPDHGGCSFDPPALFRKGMHSKDPYTKTWHKRLARFMPRWASRITLEITGVRIERLQEISDEDAIAEGIHAFGNGYYHTRPTAPTEDHFNSAVMAYRDLWGSINGPGSWEKTPFVWIVEFRRVKP